MRDYRDAKAMAQTLRAALAAKGVKISVGESLELIAKAFGTADWNTLSATIRSTRTDKAPERGQAPPDGVEPTSAALERIAKAFGAADWESLLATIRAGASAPAKTTETPAFSGPAPERPAGGNRFCAQLEATLHRAVALAQTRKQSYTTLEHLLLALTDDADAAAVFEACRVDTPRLKASLTRQIDEELAKDDVAPVPTSAFHRVIQRAVIHVQSAGRYPVTGANVLVAIFSEQESHAAYFLREQEMTRYDAVNFIANGFRKGDAAA
jgi:hypothetical protein